ATPQMVKAHQVASSYDFALAIGQNKFYYVGGDAANGFEPWVSDGSVAGTKMIKDIMVGTASSVDQGGSGNWTYMTTVGDVLYFGAADLTNGRELWKSDG